jgi:hypothetical protein
MKRQLKALLKPFWRMTGVLRRPLSARISAQVARGVEGPLRGVYEHLEVANSKLAQLEHADGPIRAIEREIQISRAQAMATANDANLLFDCVVREMARLQRQVEVLQHSIDELLDAREGLLVVGRFPAESSHRSKVG